MATTYRFFKDGEVDVFLDTDASDDQKQFFVTDVRGLDPEEIRLAFEPMIKPYNEGELIQYSKDKGVGLVSFDKARGERILYVSGLPYGIFNGTSSYMTIPNINVAQSTDPETLDGLVTISYEVRLDEQGLAQANTQLEFGFWTLFNFINNGGISLDFDKRRNFIPNVSLEIGVYGYMEGDNSTHELSEYYTFEPNVWYEIKGEFSNNKNTPIQTITIFVDDVQIATADLDEDLGLFAPTTYYVGSQADSGSRYVRADIRNILLTTQGGAVKLIDIKDPSTGVNEGTGSNGVSTDITQGRG